MEEKMYKRQISKTRQVSQFTPVPRPPSPHPGTKCFQMWKNLLHRLYITKQKNLQVLFFQVFSIFFK